IIDILSGYIIGVNYSYNIRYQLLENNDIRNIRLNREAQTERRFVIGLTLMTAWCRRTPPSRLQTGAPGAGSWRGPGCPQRARAAPFH
ncbi:MAG: hypothetical protein ACYDH9_10035, partial [Limisphaerales bacterium]